MVSRLEQFRAVPEGEGEHSPEEESKPSGRGRPKAKAKARGRPKGKAKAKARAKAPAPKANAPKAKAKAKAKTQKPKGTTRKRKAEEHQHEEDAAQQDVLVTPPKRSTRKDDAEDGSKTKRAKPAPKTAPRQRKRASRGEAVSFARRNPPEGERQFAEWKAIREAYRVNLAHLKPQSKHEDTTD